MGPPPETKRHFHHDLPRVVDSGTNQTWPEALPNVAKIQKTADELKSIIFDRIGIKTTVRAHETWGWIATPYTVHQCSRADLNHLDRVLIELRGKYDLQRKKD